MPSSQLEGVLLVRGAARLGVLSTGSASDRPPLTMFGFLRNASEAQLAFEAYPHLVNVV